MARGLVLLASLCCFAISGCLLRGPEITVKSPVEVRSAPAGKSFCPPGQAKKGNC
jgi:hypothetical protein